ncbi:MAG: hypothetical protein ACT4OS_11675 [Acidimicrobiales bacterium]
MVSTRKLISGSFVAIVVFLVVAGVAYACVPFRGKASTTVSQGTGGGTFSNSGVHEGEGGSDFHKYCATGTDVTPDGAATAGAGNVLTVTVSAGTTCLDDLGTGTRTVYINNASSDSASPFSLSGTSWSFVTGKGCWASPTPAGRISLGTMAVTSGSGTGTYTLPNLNRVDTASRASGLCVGTSDAGMIIPIKVNDITV